ncbi:MAG: hypothetical protein HQK78_12250, partial [Desulfobacterales bacterium]|nr:hypothetical protein [Desulfobacterales bacterium]
RPFDPEHLPDFSGIDPSTLDAPAGLGLYLSARLVDLFNARNLGSMGKEIRLIKRLKGSWQLSKEPDGFRQIQTLYRKEDFDMVQVRSMRPEEAIQVSRLIYDVYHYTYMSEIPYNPHRLRQLQEDGRLYSFVAVLGNGVVASHVALQISPDMPRLGEYCLAATLPEARGYKLAEKVGLALLETVMGLGITGLYANFTTVHTISQRKRQGLGTAVGFLLARSPETLQMKDILETAPQRVSTLLMFQSLVEREPVIVYIPEQHRDFISDIYCRCKLPVKFDTKVTDLPDINSQLEILIEKERNIAKLSVIEAGRDLLPQIKERLFGLRLNNTSVVFSFLNLMDPHTPKVAAILEEMGFFITGVLPLGIGINDALLMTCLINCALDYDKIELFDKESKDLLNYVRRQDPSLPKLLL